MTSTHPEPPCAYSANRVLLSLSTETQGHGSTAAFVPAGTPRPKPSSLGPDAPVTDLITLTRHTLSEQRRHASASGDLTLLLVSLQLSCKYVSSLVRRAGLANVTGLAGGGPNIQGEKVQRLDVLANEVFMNSLRTSGRAAVLVSEEDENAFFVTAAPEGSPDADSRPGRYVVCFDPLDGSSNIDCGVSIGSIFGIYRLPEGSDGTSLERDVLRPGTELMAAGYALYGSFTGLVLATGDGVNGYTLDPSLGEFILTHPSMRIPSRGNIYSINEGNASKWGPAVTRWVNHCKFPEAPTADAEGKPLAGLDEATLKVTHPLRPAGSLAVRADEHDNHGTRKPRSLRYVGSMVADVHRTFLHGGVFAYPADRSSPNGKLRILYEVLPMAFLCEQAGGRCTTGLKRALAIRPDKLHARTGIFLGSALDVAEVERMYQDEENAKK
ncbi:fructose-1,6-bisphosphatase I [Fonticula alba]|uniref:fructose-bisphosphatase n=1 Tax=Fonticula alba TaxID=691883 RepID=A0A058Z3A2_FONAL|nr:fructose-1,6-bisphosphatase I [Fonticula alba]KCV68779.1 fructose-1,6-bisphosphatase I [Fonticula alba]|eukprot:XP_009496350.1 fructose-1,6-bisphosphatase I [Fonticula alba]